MRTPRISKVYYSLTHWHDFQLKLFTERDAGTVEEETRDQLTKVKPSLEKNDHFKKDIPNKPL